MLPPCRSIVPLMGVGGENDNSHIPVGRVFSTRKPAKEIMVCRLVMNTINTMISQTL